MTPPYDVKLYYFQSYHLNQVYDGFSRLQKQGLVKLHIIHSNGNQCKPILHTEINGKHVIYDCLDGLNWIDKSFEANIDYFNDNIYCDFYFKRSWSDILLPYISNRFQYYPLGVYYHIDPIGRYPQKLIQHVKELIIKNPIIEQLNHKKIFRLEDMEMPPIVNNDNKILFLARLWNPKDVSCESRWYEERIQMNEMRIKCVEEGRKYFGNRFVGGIQKDDYSEMACPPELIVEPHITRRDRFLELVKKANICVATTGLFDSIGSKFGEYIAASRAIVSEPLKYKLPGTFSKNRNYLEFKTIDNYLEVCERLMSNPDLLIQMIHNNYDYYQNYVRSDRMILNTLQLIK